MADERDMRPVARAYPDVAGAEPWWDVKPDCTPTRTESRVWVCGTHPDHAFAGSDRPVERYPEHEKLSRVSDLSHQLGEMLDWMQERGYMLARWPETEFKQDRLIVVHKTVNQWLAEFYDIDLVKIEAEKRQMLDEIRAQNAART